MRTKLAAATWFALLAAFALVPLAVLLVKTRTAATEGWWLPLTSPEGLWALRGTLVTSLGASVFATVVGVPLALLLERTDVSGRTALKTALTLPTAIPPYIWAMGWVALANPRAGLLNLVFGVGTFDIYGWAGIAFVVGGAGLPIVVLPVSAALQRLDSSLEEAARVSGASVARTLTTVALPLALPAALSGAALVFLFAASSFGVPYLLGVGASPPAPTLTTRMYSDVLMGAAGLNHAAALSVELLVLAAFVLLLSSWASKRGQVRLALGKGVTRRPLPLGPWRRLVSVVAAAVVFVLVALPLLAVFLTSVQSNWGQLSGFTVKHWAAVLTHSRTLEAAGRSTLLSGAAAVAVTLAGLGMALTRRRWLTTLGDAVAALPGTVFALALVVTFSRDVRFVAFERVAFVLALGNTLWLVLIAYVVKHLAYGVRNTGDGLAQLDPSLTEAARLSGAGPWRAFVDATLPQLWGPLVSAFVLTFLTCMTELTVSVLLVPPGGELLGTLIFELQSYADPASAAVIACVFVLLVVAASLATARLTKAPQVTS